MTPTPTKLPRVVCTDSGILIGDQVYDEESAALLVRYIGSALKKFRRRQRTGQIAVTRTATGIHVPGLGELKPDAALMLATAIADELTVTPATAGGDRRRAPTRG